MRRFRTFCFVLFLGLVLCVPGAFSKEGSYEIHFPDGRVVQETELHSIHLHVAWETGTRVGTRLVRGALDVFDREIRRSFTDPAARDAFIEFVLIEDGGRRGIEIVGLWTDETKTTLIAEGSRLRNGPRIFPGPKTRQVRFLLSDGSVVTFPNLTAEFWESDRLRSKDLVEIDIRGDGEINLRSVGIFLSVPSASKGRTFGEIVENEFAGKGIEILKIEDAEGKSIDLQEVLGQNRILFPTRRQAGFQQFLIDTGEESKEPMNLRYLSAEAFEALPDGTEILIDLNREGRFSIGHRYLVGDLAETGAHYLEGTVETVDGEKVIYLRKLVGPGGVNIEIPPELVVLRPAKSAHVGSSAGVVRTPPPPRPRTPRTILQELRRQMAVATWLAMQGKSEEAIALWNEIAPDYSQFLFQLAPEIREIRSLQILFTLIVRGELPQPAAWKDGARGGSLASGPEMVARALGALFEQDSALKENLARLGFLLERTTLYSVDAAEQMGVHGKAEVEKAGIPCLLVQETKDITRDALSIQDGAIDSFLVYNDPWYFSDNNIGRAFALREAARITSPGAYLLITSHISRVPRGYVEALERLGFKLVYRAGKLEPNAQGMTALSEGNGDRRRWISQKLYGGKLFIFQRVPVSTDLPAPEDLAPGLKDPPRESSEGLRRVGPDGLPLPEEELRLPDERMTVDWASCPMEHALPAQNVDVKYDDGGRLKPTGARDFVAEARAAEARAAAAARAGAAPGTDPTQTGVKPGGPSESAAASPAGAEPSAEERPIAPTTLEDVIPAQITEGLPAEVSPELKAFLEAEMTPENFELRNAALPASKKLTLADFVELELRLYETHRAAHPEIPEFALYPWWGAKNFERAVLERFLTMGPLPPMEKKQRNRFLGKRSDAKAQLQKLNLRMSLYTAISGGWLEDAMANDPPAARMLMGRAFWSAAGALMENGRLAGEELLGVGHLIIRRITETVRSESGRLEHQNERAALERVIGEFQDSSELSSNMLLISVTGVLRRRGMLTEADAQRVAAAWQGFQSDKAGIEAAGLPVADPSLSALTIGPTSPALRKMAEELVSEDAIKELNEILSSAPTPSPVSDWTKRRLAEMDRRSAIFATTRKSYLAVLQSAAPELNTSPLLFEALFARAVFEVGLERIEMTSNPGLWRSAFEGGIKAANRDIDIIVRLSSELSPLVPDFGPTFRRVYWDGLSQFEQRLYIKGDPGAVSAELRRDPGVPNRITQLSREIRLVTEAAAKETEGYEIQGMPEFLQWLSTGFPVSMQRALPNALIRICENLGALSSLEAAEVRARLHEKYPARLAQRSFAEELAESADLETKLLLVQPLVAAALSDEAVAVFVQRVGNALESGQVDEALNSLRTTLEASSSLNFVQRILAKESLPPTFYAAVLTGALLTEALTRESGRNAPEEVRAAISEFMKTQMRQIGMFGRFVVLLKAASASEGDSTKDLLMESMARLTSELSGQIALQELAASLRADPSASMWVSGFQEGISQFTIEPGTVQRIADELPRALVDICVREKVMSEEEAESVRARYLSEASERIGLQGLAEGRFSSILKKYAHEAVTEASLQDLEQRYARAQGEEAQRILRLWVLSRVAELAGRVESEVQMSSPRDVGWPNLPTFSVPEMNLCPTLADIAIQQAIFLEVLPRRPLLLAADSVEEILAFPIRTFLNTKRLLRMFEARNAPSDPRSRRILMEGLARFLMIMGKPVPGPEGSNVAAQIDERQKQFVDEIRGATQEATVGDGEWARQTEALQNFLGEHLLPIAAQELPRALLHVIETTTRPDPEELRQLHEEVQRREAPPTGPAKPSDGPAGTASDVGLDDPEITSRDIKSKGHEMDAIRAAYERAGAEFNFVEASQRSEFHPNAQDDGSERFRVAFTDLRPAGPTQVLFQSGLPSYPLVDLLEELVHVYQFAQMERKFGGRDWVRTILQRAADPHTPEATLRAELEAAAKAIVKLYIESGWPISELLRNLEAELLKSDLIPTAWREAFAKFLGATTRGARSQKQSRPENSQEPRAARTTQAPSDVFSVIAQLEKLPVAYLSDPSFAGAVRDWFKDLHPAVKKLSRPKQKEVLSRLGVVFSKWERELPKAPMPVGRFAVSQVSSGGQFFAALYVKTFLDFLTGSADFDDMMSLLGHLPRETLTFLVMGGGSMLGSGAVDLTSLIADRLINGKEGFRLERVFTRAMRAGGMPVMESVGKRFLRHQVAFLAGMIVMKLVFEGYKEGFWKEFVIDTGGFLGAQVIVRGPQILYRIYKTGRVAVLVLEETTPIGWLIGAAQLGFEIWMAPYISRFFRLELTRAEVEGPLVRDLSELAPYLSLPLTDPAKVLRLIYAVNADISAYLAKATLFYVNEVQQKYLQKEAEADSNYSTHVMQIGGLRILKTRTSGQDRGVQEYMAELRLLRGKYGSDLAYEIQDVANKTGSDMMRFAEKTKPIAATAASEIARCNSAGDFLACAAAASGRQQQGILSLLEDPTLSDVSYGQSTLWRLLGLDHVYDEHGADQGPSMLVHAFRITPDDLFRAIRLLIQRELRKAKPGEIPIALGVFADRMAKLFAVWGDQFLEQPESTDVATSSLPTFTPFLVPRMLAEDPGAAGDAQSLLARFQSLQLDRFMSPLDSKIFSRPQLPEALTREELEIRLALERLSHKSAMVVLPLATRGSNSRFAESEYPVVRELVAPYLLRRAYVDGLREWALKKRMNEKQLEELAERELTGAALQILPGKTPEDWRLQLRWRGKSKETSFKPKVESAPLPKTVTVGPIQIPPVLEQASLILQIYREISIPGGTISGIPFAAWQETEMLPGDWSVAVQKLLTEIGSNR